MTKLGGTVFLGESRERAVGAVVKARPASGESHFAVTDEDGVFTFAGLLPGDWTVLALAEDGASSAPQAIVLTQDRTDLRLSLRRAMATGDTTSGVRVFWALIAGLIALVVVYVILHRAMPPPAEPVSATLVGLADAATHQVAAGEKPAERPEAVASVALLKQALAAVLAGNPETVPPADRPALTAAADQIERAVRENRSADALASLATLRGQLAAPPGAAQPVFWSRPPGRYFEVLFWGLAGILVSLIITVATYLRWGRYYREGWSLHVAQLVIIPLLVLVVVSLLSLTKLNLTIGSTEIDFDLEDPLLLACVSFLIAMGPWDAVRFIRTASSQLLGPANPPRPDIPG